MRFFFRSLLAAALLLAGSAVAGGVTARGKGIDSNRNAAIHSALVQAVAQVKGVTLASVDLSNSESVQSSAYNSKLGNSREAEFSSSISRTSGIEVNGNVLSYTIVSEAQDAATGRWVVEVEAVVPGDYVVGLDPDNRRRLAIIDFRVVGNTYSWMGQEGSTVDWSRSLTDKLNVRFAKTRRFTMLERKFLAEINDELAGLSDANIAPGEIARRCQRLATDYLVVGEVKFYPVAAPTVNPYTGRAMPMGSQLFAEVNYRVVLAATGQLKFADIVKIDAASFVAATIGAFESETTDAAASLIIDGILANYKLRDAANDGTEGAETAVDTVNRTPILQYVEPPAATTIRGNGTGGIVTPF